MAVPSSNPPKSFFKGHRLSFFKVNLLIHKGEQPQLSVRLIKWMLSSGKFFIIIVELVTVSAFVYRYKLDSDLIDLQEKITEQIPYVQSLKNDEILIRQTQFQLATIKQIKKSAPNFTQILVQISKLTPQTIKLTSINLSNPPGSANFTLSISGQSPSNLELSAFIKALRQEPNFSNITLTNISFEGQITFTLTGELKQAGGKTS